MKHTPGPWTARPLNNLDGPHIKTMWIVEGTRGWVASQVNANSVHLVAAAPEILDALVLAEQYLSKAIADGQMENCAIPLSNAIKPIRAAITKAISE